MPRLSINIILVGVEMFTAGDRAEIHSAITRTSNILATAGITLDRVGRFEIPLERSRAREIIDNDGEAVALTDEWTVDNNNIDVFIVREYVGDVVGYSPKPGPCDKNAKGMDGVVMEISFGDTGVILAHEIGHYLGLEHRDNDPSNLMFPYVPNGGQLDAGQAALIRCHCFIEDRGLCVS